MQLAWYMKFLKENGFNAIRFLFNHEMMLQDTPLDPPNEEKYGRGAPWEAPELAHLSYRAMFLRLAKAAAEHGILVLLACHRLNAAAWPGDGLWYDSALPEARVLDSWSTVAATYCGQWNVFAVDLQNEPHASSWGLNRGDASDWGHAAERLGNHVLYHCPRWMVFVEGVGYDPGAKGQDTDGIWWGENLAAVRTQPVRLVDQSKLVYSPHTCEPGARARSRAPSLCHASLVPP